MDNVFAEFFFQFIQNAPQPVVAFFRRLKQVKLFAFSVNQSRQGNSRAAPDDSRREQLRQQPQGRGRDFRFLIAGKVKFCACRYHLKIFGSEHDFNGGGLGAFAAGFAAGGMDMAAQIRFQDGNVAAEFPEGGSLLNGKAEPCRPGSTLNRGIPDSSAFKSAPCVPNLALTQ